MLIGKRKELTYPEGIKRNMPMGYQIMFNKIFLEIRQNFGH